MISNFVCIEYSALRSMTLAKVFPMIAINMFKMMICEKKVAIRKNRKQRYH